MADESGSRRQFLRSAASLFGGSWLAAQGPLLWAAAEQAGQAMAMQSAWIHLTPDQALTLSALVDQIFPPDELPGASELGAVYFIDAALGGFMAGSQQMLQLGLADLDERAGGAGAFRQLAFDQQTELLQQVETSDFFGAAHFLTLCGLFALPAYGGNLKGRAWEMIGFETRHVWQPPFGYYDAEYAKEAEHARS